MMCFVTLHKTINEMNEMLYQDWIVDYQWESDCLVGVRSVIIGLVNIQWQYTYKKYQKNEIPFLMYDARLIQSMYFPKKKNTKNFMTCFPEQSSKWKAITTGHDLYRKCILIEIGTYTISESASFIAIAVSLTPRAVLYSWAHRFVYGNRGISITKYTFNQT